MLLYFVVVCVLLFLLWFGWDSGWLFLYFVGVEVVFEVSVGW